MEGTKPVNKKLAAALSGGAVLVLALTGCSSDDGNEKLDAWAKEVCDAVQPQAKKIEAANAAIQKETSDNSTPEEVQKTDSKAFQDMSAAYKAIGAAVNKAGAPDVENGEKKQQDAVKELNGISTSYSDLKKQVDGLDTDDQAKFADGLKDIATELDKLSKSGNDALRTLEEGEVGEAMSRQASCKTATAPASGS
ncbi:small secreted protein [Streptomyces sp. NPDC012461]|jgi:archaellum component FlaC|uniref:Small secreted protein n=2 Tax=unclassified Streptomyces TaxID=2593676 RepID=A0A6G3QTE0_9ACTN|nr:MULTISPECIES: small secreted protein [unclassified Streptomyces]MBM7090225.1 small secreted protein [Streptomyces sp. S12]NEA86450.1 small secreted protein [Streptomyces sp. SID14436]NEC25550.1 small secreted protein [Streptomyces sp. SID8111]NEC79568.1 small secreted protein [Streptomyces sp. SID7958]NED18374.1 small secreted protein [Streptomyces sp. SID9913]